MNNPSYSCRLRQAGFTLVEFLVALVIGMLVVLAAIASMIGTRATSMTSDDVNALQQSSALAFKLLGQQIRQAGYIPIDDAGTPLYYFDFNTDKNTNLASAPVFFAVKGQEATGGSVNDRLTIGYAPSPDYFKDCNGQGADYDPANPANPAKERLITSEFYVSTSGTLLCAGSGGSVAQPIVEGVERFDVTYGIGAAAGNEQVVRYVSATNVATFASVRTVRVCLQLVGNGRNNTSGSYTDCGGTEQTSSDGKLRRVYTAVFALRNNLGAL